MFLTQYSKVLNVLGYQIKFWKRPTINYGDQIFDNTEIFALFLIPYTSSEPSAPTTLSLPLALAIQFSERQFQLEWKSLRRKGNASLLVDRKGRKSSRPTFRFLYFFRSLCTHVPEKFLILECDNSVIQFFSSKIAYSREERNKHSRDLSCSNIVI